MGALKSIFLLVFLVYSFPAFAADHGTVETYAAMRLISPDAGDTITLDATGTVLDGTFTCANTAYGAIPYQDDLGISISTANAKWWRRDYMATTYSSSNPIKLDWFQVVDTNDITNILKGIAGATTPSMYVQAPTTVMTLICDYIDFSTYSLSAFSFLESAAAVTIEQKSDTATKGILWEFDGSGVIIGGTNLNLTFTGVHPKDSTGGVYDSADGFIKITDDALSTIDAITIQANFHDTYDRSIYIYAANTTPYKVNIVTLKGNHLNAGIIVSFVKNLVVDNVLITDPYCRSLGWTGVSGENNHDDNPYDADTHPHGYVRTRSFVTNYIGDSITGTITFEYGKIGWGSFVLCPYIGLAGNPFTIKFKSLGYSSTGIALDMNPAPVSPEHGKFSTGAGAYPYGQRYIKFQDLTPTEGGYGYNLYYGFKVQASRASCTPAKTNNLDITLENFTVDNDYGHNDLANSLDQYGTTCERTGDPDESQGHKVHGIGTMEGILRVGNQDEIDGGTWNNIIFYRRAYNDSPYWEGLGYDPAYQLCSLNTVRDLAITGQLIADQDCGANMATNIRFSKASGAIVTVASGNTLTMNNCCAIPGTTITGAGTAILDGVTLTLPYTWNKCGINSLAVGGGSRSIAIGGGSQSMSIW